MLNNSENQEIPPGLSKVFLTLGLSLQNDPDKNRQNDENEKYTENQPSLETSKLDVKRRRGHCEICNITFRRRRILKDHQEFFHDMDNNWEQRHFWLCKC